MKNQYEIAKETIIKSDYEIKGLKTFMGMEGYGVNASLYYKKAYEIDKENLRLKNKAYPE